MDAVPQYLSGAGAAVRAMMNTQVFSIMMPELTKQYGNTFTDLRCGLNKKYLESGHLDDQEPSNIKFHQGDRVELDLHIGCAVLVY